MIFELFVVIITTIIGGVIVALLQGRMIEIQDKRHAIDRIRADIERERKAKPLPLGLDEPSGRCPQCGSMGNLTKKWMMAGRPDKSGKKMELEIGLFHCPKCHKPFRAVLKRKKSN